MKTIEEKYQESLNYWSKQMKVRMEEAYKAEKLEQCRLQAKY